MCLSLHLLARQFQVGLHLDRLILGHEWIRLGEVAQHSRGQIREVDVLVSVVRHHGVHRQGLTGSDPQRPRGSHRVADDADRRIGICAVGTERHDAREDQTSGGIHVRLRQTARGLCHVARLFTRQQCRRHGGESAVGQLLHGRFHALCETPPGVEHQHPGARSCLGGDQVGATSAPWCAAVLFVLAAGAPGVR